MSAKRIPTRAEFVAAMDAFIAAKPDFNKPLWEQTPEARAAIVAHVQTISDYWFHLSPEERKAFSRDVFLIYALSGKPENS